jgi:hypothetical protein
MVKLVGRLRAYAARRCCDYGPSSTARSQRASGRRTGRFGITQASGIRVVCVVLWAFLAQVALGRSSRAPL